MNLECLGLQVRFMGKYIMIIEMLTACIKFYFFIVFFTDL